MRTPKILQVLSILCLANACESAGSSPVEPSAEQDTKTPSARVPSAPPQSTTPRADGADKTTPQSFGAPFATAPEVPEVTLSQLLEKPSQYADKTIVTSGTVERACSTKGCWMEIADGDSKCRVTFKDYGFFVPTDSAGAQSRLQGKIATKTLSAGRVKHLEQEGARFANKAADGTAQEVRLIATAVQLTH